MKFLGEPQSGSVSSLTYSHNRFGQYTKNRNGRGGTPLFSIAAAVAAWQALTYDQQQGWNEWALLIPRPDSLGQKRVLSGYLRFLSAWKLVFPFGVTPTDAPTELSSMSAESFTLSVSAGALVQGDLLASSAGSGTGWGEVWMTFPAGSTGSTRPPPRGTYWRFIGGSSVTPGGMASTALLYLPTGTQRVFGRGRLIRPDFVAGPWIHSPFVDVV